MPKSLPDDFKDNIFHAYDVRGVYPSQINAEEAYKIAHAYFSLFPGIKYAVGYDMRESSPELLSGIILAANELGKTIDNVGMVATDFLYFAVGKYDYDGGIMITASHNDSQWNGIKLVARGVIPVDIAAIREEYLSQNRSIPTDFASRDVSSNSVNYSKQYTEHVLGMVDKSKIGKFKIVVDAGNGMGGVNLRNAFAGLLQIEMVEIYCEPDSDFPHHPANPSVEEHTKELRKKVFSEQADFGIAFDGDADRCMFVDNEGKYVPGHMMTALLARILLEKNPERKIIYDYRDVLPIRYELGEEKERKSKGERKGKKEGHELGNALGVQIQPGHLFFKQAMREHDAVFGGEVTGHFYFAENFYVENSVIPVLLLLEYLSTTSQKLSDALSDYRERFFYCREQNFILHQGVEPQQVYQEFKQTYSHGQITELDGLVIEFDDWRFNLRMSHTEPVVRLNIESTSEVLLAKSKREIEEIMAKCSTKQLGYYVPRGLQTLETKFHTLLDNLWHTWNAHHILPVIDMYGETWRKNSPPTKLVTTYEEEEYRRLLQSKSYEIDQSIRLLDRYLQEPITWFTKHYGKEYGKKLTKHPISYFSMEYGLVDWLQIYSGGLGVLAGDFIKQASDFGLPMIGVGIFYHQGYFHQDFAQDGRQSETYIKQELFDYPGELVLDKEGKQLEITIEIIDHEVWARAWRLKVGRVDLILLDTNFEKNEREEDRMISAHLYGGDQDTRIRQEILLGIGGPRMLNAMEIEPSVYHMNEGHSGFLVVEIARRYTEEKGLDFEEALKLVDDQLIFTNHTLKQAGNDIFPYTLIEKYFRTYLDNLDTTLDRVYDLGKDELYAQGKFSMTLLGLRNASKCNAVSKLHGKAAEKLWPDYSLIPITNGVHMPTWVSPEIHKLLDKYVGENWHDPKHDVNYSKIQNIPHDELWQAHIDRKYKLVNSLNKELRLSLAPDILTIAWARRLASYKRPDLIMQDIERLASIVGNEEKPIQILLAGKAHPQDQIGKDILQEMLRRFSEERFWNKVVLIPGYNWQLARRMVSGSDVWLNTPYRFEEASGTSGMKAAANGVLQLTTKDGWTDEVIWEGKGWVISEKKSADSLYSLIEEITKLFYQQEAGRANTTWMSMMLDTMELVLQNYSTERMMKEYLEQLYIPVLRQ